MMSSSTVGKLSFYQSGNVVFTPVDLSNPLHVELVSVLIDEDNYWQPPVKKIDKLLKKIGLEPDEEFEGDVYLHEEGVGHGTDGRFPLYRELIASLTK